MTLKELKDAGILIKVGEQLCPKKLNGNDVYKHTGTGDLITLTSDFELVGRNRKDNDKIEKLLENENIKDLVDRGILRKIGSRNTPQQQNQVKNSNDGSVTVNVYKHLLTGDIIPISPDYKVIG